MSVEPTDLAALDELDAALAVDVEHHHLRRAWGTQHVVTAGPPGAPAVLLVHGWPQHWLAWRHVLATLATEHRVVAVDLRGFGWSATDDPVPRPTIRALAADLVDALDDLGIERATLASHDWGGWVAFRATLDRPGRFSGHVALAIMAPWLSAWSMARHVKGWSYMALLARRGDEVAGEPAAVRHLFDLSTTVPVWSTPDGDAALASYADRVGRPTSAHLTRHLYRTFLGRELWRALGPRPARLQVPTTVAIGADETISLPSHWQGRTRPGEISLVTVPGVRHWLAEEAPEATAQLIAAQAAAAAPPA